jgi:hypothetical protein
MDSLNSWNTYALNVVNTILGKQTKEKFTDGTVATAPATVTTASSGYLGLIYIVVFLLISFLVCYGSGRTSWCYNGSIGTSFPLKVFFFILCFFFPHFYYPFYALFLNPLCEKTKNVNQYGGSRR